MKSMIRFFFMCLPVVVSGQTALPADEQVQSHDNEISYTQPCSNPSILTCGQPPVFGSTIGEYSNFFAISYLNCFVLLPSAYDAPDKLYKFSLTKRTEVNIAMEILTYATNLNLFLLSSCQPANCISGSVASGNMRTINTVLDPGDYYVVVDGLYGAQGNFNIQMSCTILTTVCDLGGTFINRSDEFSGWLDASDVAPNSLYTHPEVIAAYGGNIPQPLYADIYVFYGGKPTSVSINENHPSIRTFVFVCKSCPPDAQAPPDTCAPADCIAKETYWWPTIPYSGGPYENPCSDFYYFVITGSLGADYYHLNIAPSWNCPISADEIDDLACGQTITQTHQGNLGFFNTNFKPYKECYNGTRLYDGLERYYRFVLNQPNKVTFNLSTNGPMGMFLYSFMCGENCLGYAENSALNTSTSLTATLNEGVYYLALDIDDNTEPFYTLSATCEQYSPFVDQATFLSGNFNTCVTDPAVSHQLNIAYDPDFTQNDYFNFFFRDTDGKLKGNTEASKYWHNSLQPMPVYLNGDATNDAEKCSYVSGDSFYVFISQTELGQRHFNRYVPGFAPGQPAAFQAGGFSQINTLTAVDGPVNFGTETSFLRLGPNVAEDVDLLLLTNLDWAVEKVGNTASWLTIDQTYGNSPTTLNLDFSENTSPLPRSVVLRFYATDYPDLYRQFVRIEQQGKCIVPQQVDIIPSTSTVCLGASLNFTANVGAQYQDLYNYSWNTGDTTRTILVTPQSAGQSQYVVLATNKYCFITSTAGEIINVVSGTGLVADIDLSAPVSCNGGSDGALTVTTTGGAAPFTFLWSNGATTQTIDNLSPGVYFVTVADNAGCEDVKAFPLENPPALAVQNYTIVNAGNNQDNGSIIVEITGGTPDYTYQWLSQNGTPIGQTDNSLDNVGAGIYKLRVTDANGCVFTSELYTVLLPAHEPDLDASISVFPNPTTGKWYLQFNLVAHMDAAVRMYDVLGQQVLEARPGPVQSDVLEFDLTNAASGLYLLEINLDQSVVHKIISVKK